MSCSMCLRDSDVDVCDECRTYEEYYRSLTPDEKRDEERMIAQYVAESDGL